MIERHRPLTSAEREHVARALELSRPVSRLLMIVVCIGGVPYLFVLICTTAITRAGLDPRNATIAAAIAGLILGLALLARGMQVRAEELAAHGRKLAQLDRGIVREMEIDVDEYWIVHDVFEEAPQAYLLHSGATYVLLLPTRSSFVPHAKVHVDLIEPLGFIMRNETTGPAVPRRGTLPHVKHLFDGADCRVLPSEEMPDAWRAPLAAA